MRRASCRPGSVGGNLMANMQDQIWKGATFTIERRQDPAADAVIFRFSGPFTARDMYSSLSPVALHNIFETAPPRPTPSVNIFDLTEVPYMDSCGLGLVIGHFVRCQNKGVRLIAAGVTPRVLDLFKITKTDHLFPHHGHCRRGIQPPSLQSPLTPVFDRSSLRPSASHFGMSAKAGIRSFRGTSVKRKLHFPASVMLI